METGSIRTYKISIKDMDEKESVTYYRWPLYSSTKNLKEKKTYGAMRVFVLLIGVFVLPAILIILPLYLKYKVFIDFHFIVTESDVLKITDGISPIFCEAHLLHMEGSTFNAFQTKSVKMNNTRKKHLKLYKNISLTGDEPQVWSFFLRKGTTVSLKTCSRFEGARIMIFGGIEEFRSCLLDKDTKKQNFKSGNHFTNETMNIKSLEKFSLREQNSEHTNLRLFRELMDGQPSIANGLDEFAQKKLLEICYEERILCDRSISKSHYCSSQQEKGDFTLTEYEVSADGYYVHFIYGRLDSEVQVFLDIFKPTLEYSDYHRVCLNKSHCIFPLSFVSREEVIVEIQIPNETEDDTYDRPLLLVSSCQPRKFVYLLFAATVLFVILLFAFV